MIPLRYTRNLALRALCIVYLSAFLSFYFQIPGLYGDNGVLPAKAVLENSKHKTFSAKIHYQPTLLWLAPYLGLDTSYALDVLALLGAFLAFSGLVSQKFCIIPVFTALWSLYFSLYQIGQVFVEHSFDELLLEAGFIAIFLAPFLPGSWKNFTSSTSDSISFWMVRWLLFRFFISNGVTKLMSDCPKWWTLTAFNHHFETMPLPTPLSWYSHHLPDWQLRLVAVFASFCELFVPFLFFVPIRYVSITAFMIELFLQTCIVLTGNYDFCNILIVTLLLTLLDDKFFFGQKKSKWGLFFNIAIYAGLLFLVVQLYGLKLNGNVIDSKIMFTHSQFESVLTIMGRITVDLGILSLGATFLYIFVHQLFSVNSIPVFGIISTLLYGTVAILLFLSGTVPLASLHPETNSTVDPAVRMLYKRLHRVHATNEYALFGEMKGVDGRLEIILEGSDNVEGPWKEYNFLYKPGNVNHSLPFVAPYAPKLDWQMYWAAYSTYEKQPWLLSLTHRLLIGRPEVLNLVDKLHCPFANKPPKFIRASLYKYKFTSWNQRSKPSWWERERVGEYFPPYSKDSPVLVDYLKARNLYPTITNFDVNPIWRQVLDSIRYVCNHLEATLLFWSVFTAGLAIIATSSSSGRN